MSDEREINGFESDDNSQSGNSDYLDGINADEYKNYLENEKSDETPENITLDKQTEADYLDLLNTAFPDKENISEAEVSEGTAEEITNEAVKETVTSEAENGDSAESTPESAEKAFEDISSKPEKEKNPFKRLAKWFKKLPKKKKIIVSIVAIILCIAIIAGIVGGVFVLNKFGKLGGNFQNPNDDKLYEDETIGLINGDTGGSDFKEALKAWATAGSDSIMTSKNVTNVLLIGADSRAGTNTGNTDVMLLLSLNKATKTVKLVSFLRDSYLYIDGKGGNSYCSKLNAAYSMGGPECLMQTIENNYKIDIDNFAMLNFESFKAIIDAMGGVRVDVQKYEANYINGKYDISMSYGDNILLTGEEALYFCRVRGCDADGDVSRTRRQRQVVNAIMDEIKSATVSDLNKYLDILLPYIYTGFSKSEILSLGMKAISNGWASYDRSQLQMPTEETRTSGTAGSAWIWVVDYQLAAQTLQNELYGKTNIELGDGRRTLIDIYNGVPASGGSSSGGSSSSMDNTVKYYDDNDEANDNALTTASETAVTVPGTSSVTPSDVPKTTEKTSDITASQSTTTGTTGKNVTETNPVTETGTNVTGTQPQTKPDTTANTQAPTQGSTAAETKAPSATENNGD